MRWINDFLTLLGITNGSGRWYLWWSGFFANVTIFGAVVLFYRRHNCHIHGCLRIGRHDATDANGLTHVVCRRHHPSLGKGFRLRPHHLTGTTETSGSP